MDIPFRAPLTTLETCALKRSTRFVRVKLRYHHGVQKSIRWWKGMSKVCRTGLWGMSPDAFRRQFVSNTMRWSRSLHWSFQTHRYFGKEGLEVKKHRVVKLLPVVSRTKDVPSKPHPAPLQLTKEAVLFPVEIGVSTPTPDLHKDKILLGLVLLINALLIQSLNVFLKYLLWRSPQSALSFSR